MTHKKLYGIIARDCLVDFLQEFGPLNRYKLKSIHLSQEVPGNQEVTKTLNLVR